MDELTCYSLDAYIGNWLSPDERTQFEVHLYQCAACRDELRRQQQIDRLLGEASRRFQPLPPDLIERTRQALRAGRRRHVARISVGLSAAAAIFLAVLVTFTGRDAPPTRRITAVHPPARTATRVNPQPELSPAQQLAVWMASRTASSGKAAEYPRPRVPVFTAPDHVALAAKTPGRQKHIVQPPDNEGGGDDDSKVVRGTEPFNARAVPHYRTLADRALMTAVRTAPLRPANHETKLPDIHAKEIRSCHLHPTTASEPSRCG